MWKPGTLGALLFVLALVGRFSGCTHFVDTVPLGPDSDLYEIYDSHTLEQTFVCHHAGLDGISVLLRAQARTGDIVLRLRESKEDPADIASVRISPAPGKETSFHHFPLPPQDDVNGRSFFLLIESPATIASNAVVVPYVSSGSSSDVLYLDGVPSLGHLSFKLHYSNLYIVKDLSSRVVSYGAKILWLLFLPGLLFLLPGGAAVAWLLRDGDWIERTIVATGMSVAINALLLYATMTGLRLNSAMVIGFLALCGGLIVVKGILGWRQGGLRFVSLRGMLGSLKHDPSPLALLGTFALVLGVRIFVVRDLAFPMWGDSYQHTMIAQLMVDNGGLFDSWEPYAPLNTFTYHFGFHANVALFHWLSGDSVIHSVIWVGQILNALGVLVLYPLALQVSGGNRWAGVGAVLVAGLLSPMPMYYVNWGRYTQLAAQVILPVLLWLTWQVAEKSGWDWRLGMLTVVAASGLGITHYRVILIYGVFVVALGAVLLLRRWGRWRQVGQAVLRLAFVGGLVLLLFLPWGLRIFRARIPQIGRYLIEQGSQSEFHRGVYNAVGDVSFYVPWWLLSLGLAALIWQALKRQWRGWLIALWVGGLLILANPHVFYLPGTGIVNNFAIFIMFYVPVAILVGALVGEMWHRVWHRWRWSGVGPLVVVAVFCVGYGGIQRLGDLRLEHALVTEADAEAMAWIRENTPPDAKFLVNGFMAYGDTLVAGADAGWWIPLLTERQSTLPPLVYGTETATDPNYAERVRRDFLYIRQVSPTLREGVRFLISRGVTHAYIGQGNGMVGNPGQPLLDGQALLDIPAYRLEYDRDGVRVFALLGL